MNVITSTTTYATPDKAYQKLVKELERVGRTPNNTRWLIGITPHTPVWRYVPTVIATGKDLTELIPLSRVGIMVLG